MLIPWRCWGTDCSPPAAPFPPLQGRPACLPGGAHVRPQQQGGGAAQRLLQDQGGAPGRVSVEPEDEADWLVLEAQVELSGIECCAAWVCAGVRLDAGWLVRCSGLRGSGSQCCCTGVELVMPRQACRRWRAWWS
jgi:hypothetical protein